jgi:hypothetical protein
MIDIYYMNNLNNYIKKNNIDMNIEKYINTVITNSSIDSTNKYLISFLIDLCKKKLNGFCVDVITLINLNIVHDEHKFSDIIKFNKFKNNVDYIRYKGHYYLSFMAFKILLTKYNPRYMKDIFTIEEIFKFYTLIYI